MRTPYKPTNRKASKGWRMDEAALRKKRMKHKRKMWPAFKMRRP
jgi:hypothetical protein